MIIHVYGEPVTITQETIAATRQWYHDNAMACLAEAENGDVHVNDLATYRAWQIEFAADALAGKYDNSFAFAQMAVFIQTKQSVPMLEN